MNSNNNISKNTTGNSNSDTIGIIVTTSALCAITAVAITSTIYAIYFNKEEIIISSLVSFFTKSSSSLNSNRENDNTTDDTTTKDSTSNESVSKTNVENNVKSNKNKNCTIIISLPQWLIEYQESLKDVNYTCDEDMMTVAITISSQNSINKTGGPFGCAIFERIVQRETNNDNGTNTNTNTNTKTKTILSTKLVSVGCNLVVQSNNSTLHGEMMAIQLAQSKLNTYTLRKPCHNNDDTVNNDISYYYYILVTSCEPCCMCLGSILWSGVHELICGATKNNAESIGFQEGPVFNESYTQLSTIGNILVKRNILQSSANTVLQNYYNSGNIIYNGCSNKVVQVKKIVQMENIQNNNK